MDRIYTLYPIEAVSQGTSEMSAIDCIGKFSDAGQAIDQAKQRWPQIPWSLFSYTSPPEDERFEHARYEAW